MAIGAQKINLGNGDGTFRTTDVPATSSPLTAVQGVNGDTFPDLIFG